MANKVHPFFVSAWRGVTAIAAAGAVGIWLWAHAEPAPRASLPIQGDQFIFSPDGKSIVSREITWQKRYFPPGYMGSGGGRPPAEKCQFHVYDLASRGATLGLSWDKVEVRSYAISPNGQRLAALSLWEGHVREWDLTSGAELAWHRVQEFAGKSAHARQVVYTPAGDLVVSLHREKEGCSLWNCRRGQKLAVISTPDEYGPNDFTVHGFQLIHSAQDQLKVWKLDTGELTGVFPKGPNGFCWPPDMTLSTDGKILLRGGREKVEIRHADGGYRQISPLNVESRPALSPDNRLLIAFSFENLFKRRQTIWEWVGLAEPPQDWHKLKLYDLSDGQELAAFPTGVMAKFSPDGKTLAVLDKDQTLQLWDLPLPRRSWLTILGLASLTGSLGYLVVSRFGRRRPQPVIGE